MAIFSSPFPKADIPCISCFEHLVATNDKYGLDTPACIDGITGETISRGDFVAECLSLGSGLRNLDAIDGTELKKGSAVTVYSPNCILYPVAMAALAAGGIRVVFANTTYVASELAHAITLSKSSHVIVHSSTLETTIGALSELGISRKEAKKRVVVLQRRGDIPKGVTDEGWLSVDDLQSSEKYRLPERFDGADAEETSHIFLSSGTTGRSKAVELTHHNINAILRQLDTSWSEYQHGRDVIAVVVPLFHVFGGVVNFLFSYFQGIPIVIFPGFEPQLFLTAVARYKITIFYLVPPMLKFLALHPAVDQADLSSLRVILVGAAPVSKDLMNRCEERLCKNAPELQIIQAYGLTETCGVTCYTSLESSRRKRGTAGVLISNMEAKLVDENDGEVPVGEHGELWVRGPNVMKAYLNDPEATASCLSADGWLKTGDVLKIDHDGFLTVVDRKKDIIKYEGTQVSPAELEDLIAQHPGVADVGVTGVYHEEISEEYPRAYVVPTDHALLREVDQTAFTTSIQEYVRLHATEIKSLRGGVKLVEKIPRSAAGKILRKQLHLSDQ